LGEVEEAMSAYMRRIVELLGSLVGVVGVVEVLAKRTCSAGCLPD
jgi:hypothetical protein